MTVTAPAGVTQRALLEYLAGYRWVAGWGSGWWGGGVW